MNRLVRRVPKLGVVQLGALLIALSVVAGAALFNKSAIMTTLASGESLQVDVTRDYRLRDYQSKVKIAGVPVGVVTKIQRVGDKTRLTLKVNKGTLALLGQAPSAAIRPATLLGGNYYVDVKPGGDPGRPQGAIPVSRTTVPVELDRVLEQVGPEQTKGLQTAITQLGAGLGSDGRAATKDLVAHAPGALAPTGEVLTALRGNNPDDLSALVKGLEATGRALTAQQGELGGMISGAAGTARTLAARGDDIARTVQDAPATLAATRQDLATLDVTLAKVRQTAPGLRPAVQQAGVLLGQAQPVLAKARPVVADVRALATDLRPMLADTVPVVTDATSITNDLRGPVLDRLGGPVLNTVMRPYRDGTPFYQELGYMFAGLDATAKMTDRQGASIAFHPGPGAQSAGGLPPTALDQLLASMLGVARKQP